MTNRKPVLLCPDALQSLEESLEGDILLCQNFVSRFVEMWPARFTRIHEAISAGLHAEALDAAMSLRSASMMVGAVRLTEITQGVIHFIEGGDLVAATGRLMAMNVCGHQTAAQLDTLYLNLEQPGGRSAR